MEETELESKARRASILKQKCKSPAVQTVDITLATKRRVSFSSKNRVKPFAADQDENTIWDNTYEEQADQTDSHIDKPKNQPAFQIWENLDSTLRGDMEMEFTCATTFVEKSTSILKTRSTNMEITNCLPINNSVKQETILNQSLMDFTIAPPANSETMTHCMTVNKSSTMEFTFQQANEIQDNIMQASMRFTKGLSDLNDEYCKNKSLIAPQKEINSEDTICNAITMEVTEIIPPLFGANYFVPDINPPNNIIFRDNESATMDFTEIVSSVPQTVQSQSPSASLRTTLISGASENMQKTIESNVSSGIENQPTTSLFVYHLPNRPTERPNLPKKKSKIITSAIEDNTASDITTPSGKPPFCQDPDSQPKNSILIKKTILEDVNKTSNSLPDEIASRSICLKGKEEFCSTWHTSDTLKDELPVCQEPNSQLGMPKKGILIKKTISNPISELQNVQESVPCVSSLEGENKCLNESSNKMDLSEYIPGNMSLNSLKDDHVNNHESGQCRDKLSFCQEPKSKLSKPKHSTVSDITKPSAKFSVCEKPDSHMHMPKDILINKTISESTPDTTNIKAPDGIDMSNVATRNISLKGLEDSRGISRASDASSDKLGSTYIIPKKQSLGKTYVLENINSSDKENVYPVLAVEIDKNDKENINPLLVATGNEHVRDNIELPIAATTEKHDITTGVDKENRNPLVCPSENKDRKDESILSVSNHLNDMHGEPLQKEPHVSQEYSPPAKKAREHSFSSERDISGLLQNDLSAEMFMPSQQLNEDNAYNPLNVLYSEKIKPPELSSHENSALISATSFAYNNSELDTDQLIHATFSQPDEISRGEFSIHCQDVLKKISTYLPSHRNPINFDRQERNERSRGLIKRYAEIKKETVEILSNFKLPEFKWESDRMDVEISKSESDVSSTTPSHPTIEEDENEIIAVRKTVLEKVQEAAKRVKDGRWYFLEHNECDYFFGALFKSVFIKVNIDPDTGIVTTFETYLTDTFDKEDMEPIFRYNADVLQFKLKKVHLSSVLGTQYDILTFLDYVHMCVDEVLKFNSLWVNLEIKYRRSHKIRMNRDFRVTVEVLNAEHVIWWIISMKLLVSNVPGLCEDVTAKAQLGELVSEECIKKVARSIAPGSQFLYKFMLELTEFTEKVKFRLKYKKEAEDFK